MADTRIPLDAFQDFTRAVYDDGSGIANSHRYEDAMEAIRRFEKIAPEPRQLTIARRGREPSEFIEVQQTLGEACFARTPWGGRIG